MRIIPSGATFVRSGHATVSVSLRKDLICSILVV
jgi:hypothetical protein